MILHYYSDPSHAWLKATRQLINKLGIQNQISQCSYQNGNLVYLEEDCDARLLIDRLGAHGITPTFREHISNRSSRIRNYDRYTV